VGDRYYAYWGPLTPILMLPWVALFGVGISDNLANALYGAVNVGLAYWMFRRVDRVGLRRMTERCCVALTILLAFGTVHFYLSCNGCVWHAVHIATVMPLLGSIIAAASRRNSPRAWAIAGAFFGAAFLGRNVVLLLGLFYPIVIWLRVRREGGPVLRGFLVRAVAFALPVAAAGVVQMAYNYGRFGSPLESGLAIQIRTGGDAQFQETFARYGTFNAAYLHTNLKHYFWNVHLPVVDGRRSHDPYGNSMFLVTPPLLLLLLAWRHRDGFAAALFCGAAPLVGALMFFNGTGYNQFGNRYLLDALPFLLLLIAGATGGRLTFAGAALIVAAVVMNVFGTFGFYPDQVGTLGRLFTLGVLAGAGLLAILALAVVWPRVAASEHSP
jgi:hypothetical protein